MDEATSAMTPAQRMTKGLCPECGVSLTGLGVLAHRATHWPDFIKPDGQNDEAIARHRMMTEFDKAQKGAN